MAPICFCWLTLKLTPVRRHVLAAQPPQVLDKFPESALYSGLQELEGRLDAALASKRESITEAVRQPERVPKKLRVYLYATHAGQGATSSATGMLAELL